MEEEWSRPLVTREYAGETMKAIIPAAGLGLRFLPITKEQPKEMIPVMEKPTIQYVVEEAIEAGIDDILIITGRNKRAIVDHFDKSFEIESTLEKKGDLEKLEEIKRISNMVDIHFIRQKEPRGLGDAVMRGRKHVGDEPFAVMLGDTINISEEPVIGQLMRVHERTGGSVIAVEEVAREKISDYGIIDGEPIDDRLMRIKDLVEKPDIGEAPSNIGITGRYILTPEIFDFLERTEPGRGNEVQLTDAIRLMNRTTETFAYRFEGRRYDIGDMMGWLKTMFELGLKHPRYSSELRELVSSIISEEGKPSEDR
jgi:UTP--glucose-1-phosphate uridylyltransferase